MFYRDERLALFIDGSNLYAAAKALSFDIDYRLLRQEFMRRGKMLRAFYYTALLENDDYSPIRPLVDWLHYNGFTMVATRVHAPWQNAPGLLLHCPAGKRRLLAHSPACGLAPLQRFHDGDEIRQGICRQPRAPQSQR